MLAIYSAAAFTVSGVTPSMAANATIEVRREDTGALADIFSDEDGLSPITNPSAFADAEGRFSFYAEGLERGYRIDITKDASTVTLRNQAVGTAAQLDHGAFARKVITTKGDLYVGGAAGVEARKAVGANGLVLSADSGEADGLKWVNPNTITAGLPRSYLAGLKLSNGTDATNDIDIAAGECRDDGNAANIVLAGALTKQLDAAWAVGTNAGMRATGVAIADTTYHIFAIRRPDTGVVDIAADTSVTGANIAANTDAAYTQKRRIGSLIRASAAIVAFVQDGDLFRRKAVAADVAANNPGTSAVTRTLSVPVGVRVEAICALGMQAAGAVGRSFYVSDLAVNDEAPSAGGALHSFSGGMSIAGTNYDGVEVRVMTNTSAQVRSRAGSSDANVTYTIATLGWVDRRGRDD